MAWPKQRTVALALALLAVSAAADQPIAQDLLKAEYFQGEGKTQTKPTAWSYPPGQVTWTTEDGRACLRVQGNGDWMDVVRNAPLPTPHVLSLEFKASDGMIGLGLSLRLLKGPCDVWATDHRASAGGWLRVAQGPNLESGTWYRVEVENQLLWSAVRLYPTGGNDLLGEVIAWHDPLPEVKVALVARAKMAPQDVRYFANLRVKPVEPRKIASPVPAAPVGLKVILFDDFNSPDLAKWGSRNPSGGYLRVTPPNYWNTSHLAEIPDLQLADGVIQARVRLVADGAAVIRARLNAYETGGYFLRLGSDKPVEFLLARDGKSVPIGKPVERVKLQVGKWHDVKMELAGKKLTAWVDGRQAASAEDPNATYSTGALGVGCLNGGPADFDDFAVFSSQGKYGYKPRMDALEGNKLRQHPLLSRAEDNWRQASWLAVPSVQGKNEAVLQQRFDAQKPNRAFVQAAVDGSYRLRLNGKELCPQAVAGHWYDGQLFDATAAIANGGNDLQIIIRPEGLAPAAMAVLSYEDAAGAWHRVVSDGQWKIAVAPAASATTAPAARVLGAFGMDDRPWVYSLKSAVTKVPVQIENIALPKEPVASGQPFEMQVTLRCPGGVNFPPEVQVYFLPEGVEDLPKERLYQTTDIVENPARWQAQQRLALRVGWSTPAKYMFRQGRVRVGVALGQTPFTPVAAKPAGEMALAAAPAPKEIAPSEFQFRDGFVWRGNQRYVPLAGSDGEFYLRYEPQRMTPQAWKTLIDEEELGRLTRFGLNRKPVLCRLVDWVDAAKTDHNFDEDGGLGGRSRLLEIAGETFRVTSPRRSKPAYFLYDLDFAEPTVPHIVVYRVPNDIARICTVNPIPTETGSGAAYSGVIFPLDGKAYNQMFVYYPPAKTVRFCVIYSAKYAAAKHIPSVPASGAAISGMWSLQLEEPIEAFSAAPKGGQVVSRGLGIDYTEPATWVYRIYGVQNANTPEKRRAAWASFIDYSRFAGANMAYVDFIGSDWVGAVGTYATETGGASYDSPLLGANPTGTDFFKELMPLAEEQKFRVVPTMAAFMLDGPYQKRLGVTEEMYQVKEDGQVHKMFGLPRLNPLHPHVQEVFYKALGELAQRAAAFQCADTIACRLNGFGLGLGPKTGYEAYTLKLFARETGIAVPTDDPVKAAEYLKANAWDKWIQWRCRKSQQFWAGARDVVTSQRKDLKLAVLYMLGSQFSWADVSAGARLEEIRASGLDPALLAGEKNLFFQEVWTWENRYAKAVQDWPWRSYPAADSGKALPKDLSIWSGYWEQPGVFSRLSQYQIGWISSASAWPVGRSFFENFAYGLTKINARDITLMNWERGLAQQECNLRRFSRAFLPVPLEPAKPFSGTISVVEGPLKAQDLWACFRGEKLQVVNLSGASGRISLSGVEGAWTELGRGDRYDKLQDISILPFDVLTFDPVKGN